MRGKVKSVKRNVWLKEYKLEHWGQKYIHYEVQ